MGNTQTIPEPSEWKEKVVSGSANVTHHYEKSKNIMNELTNKNGGGVLESKHEWIKKRNALRKANLITTARLNDVYEQSKKKYDKIIKDQTTTSEENDKTIHKLDEEITTNRRKYYYKTELENFYKRTTKIYKIILIIITLLVLGTLVYVYKSQILGAVSKATGAMAQASARVTSAARNAVRT